MMQTLLFFENNIMETTHNISFGLYFQKLFDKNSAVLKH